MPMWDHYQRPMKGFLKWQCWVAFFDFYAQLILNVFGDLVISNNRTTAKIGEWDLMYRWHNYFAIDRKDSHAWQLSDLLTAVYQLNVVSFDRKKV